MSETREALQRFQRLVQHVSSKAEPTPHELALVAQGRDLLRDMRIDLESIPSQRPGVPGHPGASPKQLDLQRRFFSGECRAIFAAGGNRSGKTVALWGLCFAKHLRDHARDGDLYWCIAPDFTKMRQGPHRWLWEYLPRSMFTRRYTESIGFGTNHILPLNLPDGRGRATVVFKTQDQSLDSFESDSVNGIAWTEAEREAIFDSIQSRLVDTRGFMLLDFVPNMAWHKFRLRLSGNSLWHYERFAMMDNAHNLPEGAIEEARAGMSDREAAIRIDGEEGSGFGVVIPQFEPRRHVCKRDFTTPPEWPRWRALDYGFANPTACLWITVAPDETIYVYREYYVRERTVPYNARAIQALSEGEEYRGHGVIVDPSIYNRNQANGESIGAEFRAAGLPCRPAVRTNRDGMHASVEQVRKAFEQNRIKILPRCVNLIRELQSWRCREGRDGEPLEVYEDRDDHTVDALRYVLMDNPTFTRSTIRVDSPYIRRRQISPRPRRRRRRWHDKPDIW